MADWVPDAGDLIWMDFSPALANEQVGRRPALVISGRDWNLVIGRCLVMPITRRIRSWPSEIPLPEGAIVEGAVLADQVRSLHWVARHASLIGPVDSGVLELARNRLKALAGIE